MKGHFYRPKCKCENKKRCKCGASWAYILDVGTDPKTGKRKQKKKSGFKTKQEAQNAAAELIYELQKGTYVKEDPSLTFEEFAYEWLSMYERTGKVKESTVRVRRHEIARLLDYFAKLKLKDIARKRYQDAINSLAERGFAQNTIEGAHRTGRMIFKKAVEMEVLKKDPTEFTHVPKKQKTVEELEGRKDIPNYLERKELQTFLSITQEVGLELDYLIFLTLSYTGLRAGELCALKWRDIDFQEQTISITKTYYNPRNNKKMYKLLPPKTATSIRVIDVDEIVLNELKLRQISQEKKKTRLKEAYHDEDFIFTDEYGYPIYLKKIENRMSRLLKLAELNTELTPHSLRHTHTSLLAQARVSLPEIMERLGHKDEDTTKNIYLHVTKDMKKEASRKFKILMEEQ
ncbi:tyrosine-type recombinase/integrase [Sutcliffiella halmapala]|uniref:tyrosine-type recombinase/integrase n=1 Tax=Sutcliffiella halmapala TaxID=79882 RepID=UPI000995C84A|nr:site-specific integrase [Sutcliffiella halmapala]